MDGQRGGGSQKCTGFTQGEAGGGESSTAQSLGHGGRMVEGGFHGGGLPDLLGDKLIMPLDMMESFP